MRRAAVLLAVLAALAGCRPSAPPISGDASLLPPDGFEGWSVAGPPRMYDGADLYGYIDGGAEVFLELGFERLTVETYAKGSDDIAVDLYRMSDQAAATGIFLLKQGRPSPDSSIPVTNVTNRYQVQLHRGDVYVVITNAAGTEDTAEAAVKFARFIAGRLPAEQPIRIFEVLPAEGKIAASERVIRGPFTLDAITTLGQGDILELGGGVTAVAADYDDGAGGSFTLIVAVYPTAKDCQDAFEHLGHGLDSYLTVLSSSPNLLVWRDYGGRFGEATWSGARLEVRVNLAKEPTTGRGATTPPQTAS